ncbi:hypothetical protein EI94DRAFT_1703304 [Lactarius quietus]|nr:hypothetical protein EI94DRAFT_1703304 [Lactarius quietus]
MDDKGSNDGQWGLVRVADVHDKEMVTKGGTGQDGWIEGEQSRGWTEHWGVRKEVDSGEATPGRRGRDKTCHLMRRAGRSVKRVRWRVSKRRRKRKRVRKPSKKMAGGSGRRGGRDRKRGARGERTRREDAKREGDESDSCPRMHSKDTVGVTWNDGKEGVGNVGTMHTVWEKGMRQRRGGRTRQTGLGEDSDTGNEGEHSSRWREGTVRAQARGRLRAREKQCQRYASTESSRPIHQLCQRQQWQSPKTTVVPGSAFDRFITFLTRIYGLTTARISWKVLILQPPIRAREFNIQASSDDFFPYSLTSLLNYVASVGGDFWGLGDDNLYHIPPNISTIVDILAAKDIYPERLTRKISLLMVMKDSTSLLLTTSTPLRLHLPSTVWVTPNMVDGGHDTTIDYAASWLDVWLLPLLNDNHTLILLTFDETKTYTINSQICAVLLGGAIPDTLRGTVDSTYYTPYSSLSTVEANWGLVLRFPSPFPTGKTNVFSFIANATNYTNLDISGADIPLTNLTGNILGPLNAEYYVPFTAPNTSAVGAGGGPVFVGPGMDTNLTAANAPAPVNLTTKNETVPWSGPRVAATASNSTTSGNKSGAVGARDGVVDATVLVALLAGLAALLLV